MNGIRFLILLLSVPSVLAAQGTSDVFARARRMVNEGDAKAGRAVVDSMLAAAPANSAAYAEALYWRGVLGDDGDRSRTDLLRVAVEFPLSPRASDALLRLAQAEFTRGDRGSALRHLDMLVRDHPDAPSRAAAKYWTARILLEDARPVDACGALAEAKRLAPASDVELVNQIEYYLRPCGAENNREQQKKTENNGVPQSTAEQAQVDTTRRKSSPSTPPAVRGKWSVQVAAYGDFDNAMALARKLKQRGYDARVTESKPWRVRVGRFATRAEAAEVARKLSSKGNKATIVEAEGR